MPPPLREEGTGGVSKSLRCFVAEDYILGAPYERGLT